MPSRRTPAPAAAAEPREVPSIDIVGLGERTAPVFGALANLRAIPDARDGLIPVRRRILFTADARGYGPEGGFHKSAKLVGEVMGTYHPHGDQSIYGALVRLAQDFALRYPLVAPQGNFGSSDGDGPAAMRYTEVKLAPIGALLCRDIADPAAGIVDWTDNYDGTAKEPMLLPARFPVLLACGTDGVGWGDSTTVLPHNLRELLDAAVLLVGDPAAPTERLAKALPAPDFPGGAAIVANDDWAAILETGRGRVVARAAMHTEPALLGRRQTTALVVDELPYQVSGAALIEKIETLVNEGEDRRSLAGIVADVRSESSEGTRIVIVLEPGVDPERGTAAVLAATAIGTKGAGLQKSYTVDQRVLADGLPVVMGTRGILLAWTGHQMDVLTRRTRWQLERARAQLELEEAKTVAHGNAEALVKLVKAQGSEAEITAAITARYRVTERQAAFIANLPLKTYGKLSMDAVEAAIARLRAAIAEYERLLASRDAMAAQLVVEIREIRARFGDDRRTRLELGQGAAIKSAEELLPDARCLVTVSAAGLLSRLPEGAFRATRRGAGGVAAAAKPDEDPLVAVTAANVRDRLWLLTDRGNLFGLRAADLDETARGGRGTNPRRFLGMAEGERVVAAVPAPADGALVLATAAGKVLRTRVADYANLTSGGLRAIGLAAGDRLVAALGAPDDAHLLAISSDGYAARFALAEVPAQGRGSGGVAAMKLGPGAAVVAMAAVAPDDPRDLALVLANGRGKRSRLADYPAKGRATRGVVTVDLGAAAKGGAAAVAFAAPVAEADMVLATTTRSRAVLMAATEVKRQGRATAGVITVALSASARDPEAVAGGCVVAG